MKKYDPNHKFQSIEAAARTTGLSMYFIRRGCKDGTVPHIMSGTKYLVNVDALLEMLDEASRKGYVSGWHDGKSNAENRV